MNNIYFQHGKVLGGGSVIRMEASYFSLRA